MNRTSTDDGPPPEAPRLPAGASPAEPAGSPPTASGLLPAWARGRAVERLWFSPSGAAVAVLARDVTAEELFRRLAGLPGTLFLDSCPQLQERRPAQPPIEARARTAIGPSRFLAGLGRYSFVAALPALTIHAAGPADIPAALDRVRGTLAACRVPTLPGLPPFQGGLAGLLSYEFGLAQLGIDPNRGASSPPEVPVIHLGFYDVVAAFDHATGCGWILSQGLAADGETAGPGLVVPTAGAARRRRALTRLEAFLAALDDSGRQDADRAVERQRASVRRVGGDPRSLHPDSTHDEKAFCEMVGRAIEYVRAGDIFQVNCAQTLTLPLECRPQDLHASARRVNPAPFAAFYDLGNGRSIVSGSPERFLQVSRGVVRMHPIKGTRPILRRPEADLFAGDDLAASAKDRAENVMIVDLVRNDLSRVCRDDSVRVEALCRLERYAYVQHLVSVVAGRLAAGRTPLDAILAALPAGSVTGAPKHRACEIIAELEARPRGAYCGSLGYLGFDDSADWNLLIRTFLAAGDRLSFPVGGGITSASDPLQEYRETLDKAEGLLRAVALAAAPGSSAEAGGSPG
jgi:para-aminobenzoate synthetase component 1